MINKQNLLNALEYFQNLTHGEVEYLKNLVGRNMETKEWLVELFGMKWRGYNPDLPSHRTVEVVSYTESGALFNAVDYLQDIYGATLDSWDGEAYELG